MCKAYEIRLDCTQLFDDDCFVLGQLVQVFVDDLVATATTSDAYNMTPRLDTLHLSYECVDISFLFCCDFLCDVLSLADVLTTTKRYAAATFAIWQSTSVNVQIINKFF